MKAIRTGLISMLVTLCLTVAGAAFANSDAIRTMASITMTLNHFPSDADKEQLKAIVDSDDSTEEEASIAMALMNMQHQVTAGDAQRLHAIVEDDAADADAKTLAEILLGINHMPSDADKAKLAALTGN